MKKSLLVVLALIAVSCVEAEQSDVLSDGSVSVAPAVPCADLSVEPSPEDRSTCVTEEYTRAQSEPVQVVFLDVGQGDAILVRAPEGQTALIDAGPGVNIISALYELGVERLDLVVASHPHADHIGGMRQILRAMPVAFYMDNGQPHTTTTYRALMSMLQERTDITYLEAVPRTLQLGSVNIKVLPLPGYLGSNLNNRSVGLVIEHGDFRAFLSGDSERPELQHFLQAEVVPDVTLLKAAHHGSDDAVSELFLDVARPEVIVISVGRGNRYGHPSPSAVYAYDRHADEVFRTDLQGQITILGFEDGSYQAALGETLVAQGEPRTGQGPENRLTAARPSGESETVASAIVITVFADAPGNDHQNTNGEYAMLRNQAGEAINISGWSLCDLAQHCFTFPSGTLAGKETVTIYTGRGISDGVNFYMGSGSAVWNNNGDTATLYDSTGRVVADHVY